jgi:hypothetical protein
MPSVEIIAIAGVVLYCVTVPAWFALGPGSVLARLASVAPSHPPTMAACEPVSPPMRIAVPAALFAKPTVQNEDLLRPLQCIRVAESATWGPRRRRGFASKAKQTPMIPARSLRGPRRHRVASLVRSQRHGLASCLDVRYAFRASTR